MASSNLADDPVVPGSAPPPTNALVAIVELPMGGLATDDRVRIGLVSVVPPTGEVVWDEFDGKIAGRPFLMARLSSPIRVGDTLNASFAGGALATGERS